MLGQRRFLMACEGKIAQMAVAVYPGSSCGCYQHVMVNVDNTGYKMMVMEDGAVDKPLDGNTVRVVSSYGSTISSSCCSNVWKGSFPFAMSGHSNIL